MCLCNVRACWLRVCVSQACVCPRAPAPQLSTLGCLSPLGLCLLGIRQGFPFQRMGKCLGCTGVGWGTVAREEPWGEESFLCQIPKCHLGAACAA